MSANEDVWESLADARTMTTNSDDPTVPYQDAYTGDREPSESAVDLAVRILAATGQPLLARQLAEKLARWSVEVTAAALDTLLVDATASEPGLTRDELGRWRLRSATLI